MSRASAAPCLTGPSATFAYTGQETSCTIVTGGTYEITAWGGTGGVAVGRNDAGGLPARLSILASLASNTDLTLLVGGAGSNGNPVDFIAGGGGGGGSFVVSGKTPILVAGGGGGGGSFNGGAGQIGTSGGNGGSNLIGVTGGSGGSLGRGGGAPSSGGGGGGGGLSGSGGGSGGGVSFIGGGAGGAAQYYAAGAGGFGGGGGGGKYSSGGGGGGYSGGGAGYGNYGGGGGSFAVAGSTVLSAQSGYAAPTSDGEIILTAVPTPEPASAALLGIGLAALGLTTVRGRRSLRAT